jgi:hypothetical protein
MFTFESMWKKILILSIIGTVTLTEPNASDFSIQSGGGPSTVSSRFALIYNSTINYFFNRL